jgi:hypothetical protein
MIRTHIENAATHIITYLSDNQGADAGRKLEIINNIIDDAVEKIVPLIEGKRLERIERYLENNFLAGQHVYLSRSASTYADALMKKPKDIQLMSKIKNIDNDLRLIENRMHEVNAEIFRDFEERHGNGLKFKFFSSTPPTPVKPNEPKLYVGSK